MLANDSDSDIWQAIVNDYITWLTPTALHEIERFIRNTRLKTSYRASFRR